MTPDELKERVAEFMENNDLHDDGEHTCGYSHDLLGHNLESLCREMIAEGLERAAVIAGDGGFISDTSAEARFGKECAGAIRREAHRVKGRI